MFSDITTSNKKFGTFLGVFLPSILTFLGLIMYLRLSWVVGNLGLGGTILLVLVASLITFISALSAAAIATNKIEAGGVYYIVSRSFGLETGGAIGIAFYISRVFSVTFYSLGLAESILVFWPEGAWGPMPSYAISLLTALIIFSITYLASKSIQLALKAQIPIFILVMLSVLALVIGVFAHGLQAPEWEPTYRTANGGFWLVFAVFFPGVTGFLTGVSLSGELREPGRSIPRGTIAAILFGTLIYVIILIMLAVSAKISSNELADPDLGLQIWSKVALFGGWLIYPAAWGAILSSAISSILSGPRLLRSLSLDGSLPKVLSKLSKNGQPATATWITGGIALLLVFLGDLHTVAKYVTFVFLTLYTVINLVAALEKLVAEPSFRPKFHIPWYISMTGAVGALVAMFLINPLAATIALVLELSFYFYLKKRALEQQWGDINAGIWVQLARFALLRMNQRTLGARNWRPLLLVFVKDIHERIELVKLAAALGQNSGVLTVSKLVYEHDADSIDQIDQISLKMKKDLRSYGLEAFCEVNIVRSIPRGIFNIARGHGIAGLKTNTVIFGWSGTLEGDIQQLKIIRRLATARKNILLVKFNDHDSWKEKKHQQIDIWWSGHEHNGDLMLILAYMLKLNREWSYAQINIRAVVETIEEQELLSKGIEKSIESARIPASIDVFLKHDDHFPEILARKSKNADVSILGLRSTKEGLEEEHARKLQELSRVGKIVIFMQNNSVKEKLPVLLTVTGKS